MNSSEIRQCFIDYYEDMGYLSLPKAPMLDPSIPMSFVMSAGLVQVENSLARSGNRDGNRYVLVQDCFRHFDLEKVGTDDIHLSFFEMPGAFIFGPDGKAGTVRRMWTLATSILGLEKEDIWASYFKGGTIMGEQLPEDTATYQAWMEVGISENHIVGLGTDNNYWLQGKGIDDINISRKCGPNTELFFDRGIKKACGQNCKPGCQCGRFVEFSNSLFISSEIKQNDRFIQPLANPFTETVIGTERVSMIHQNAVSVFDTLEFKPLLDIIHDLVHVNKLSRSLIKHCERVIADHIKGLFFLVADGAPPPGKNGRERIIKTLIRRVITRLFILNIDVQQSVPGLIESISINIPNIDQRERVNKLLIGYFLSEYQRFTDTVKRGQHQLAQLLRENKGHTLSGEQIVFLEKKWGLPSLLTALSLQEQGLLFAEEEYKTTLNAINYSDGRRTK